MHVSIRRYRGNSALAEELRPHQDEIARLLRDISGFRAYYLLSTADGDSVSVSVYDDQAGAEASNAVAREWLAANKPDLAVEPPEVTVGETAITV
jgi:hypothetical protein